MKKWLIALVLILCVGILFPVAKNYQKQEPLPAPQSVPTWSTFKEYKQLTMLLKGFAIESVIDIFAVDIQTLKEHSLGVKKYIGATESKDEALALQAQFGSEVRSFIPLDITIDRIPCVDLLFCWDQFCTMSRERVEAALWRIKKSGSKYLLMRHYPHVEKNSKNKKGAFKPINWKLAPYHFPEPIIQINETHDPISATLSLWSIDHL